MIELFRRVGETDELLVLHVPCGESLLAASLPVSHFVCGIILNDPAWSSAHGSPE